MVKDLTTTQRNQVVQFILQGSIDGKPKHGRILEAVQKFSTSRSTVTRLWRAARKQHQAGEVIHSVSRKITTKRRTRVHLDLTVLSNLEYTKRGTIRKLAVGLETSKSTIGRWVKTGKIRAHTSALKPDLTATNKLLRLRFSLESLELDRILNKIKFRDMHNTVHIDEKWFYITRGSHRYYLAPGEPEPHRTCKSKKFITKIMFMCAVTRPLIAENGTVLFDGKIGIFPFTIQVPAKRNSRNRQAGTLETKAIESITKEVIKDCLINKIIPAIMAKWPEGASKDIFIQQDNARPHILDNDPDFRKAASQGGFNIRLTQQPPNSPDCNGCMMEIMKFKGQNCYKILHMGKDALRRLNQLPQNLEVPVELIQGCIDYLNEMGNQDGITEIVQSLGLDEIEGY
ncbi:uncharacterized protein LOC131008478 [Salvia miltiorrhiza]|uniref:uncharacterized protein LOC131008478 n=1 Tax=Salvia miltiorrhiza TaxID=226208 RepID=UPI0025AD4C4D|nr:uncharacterized protein LOC131008478 [Salvia miltiorrhiza]